MNTAVAAIPDATGTVRGCTHHWIIDNVEGRFSKGRCRLCGRERLFNNFLSDCLAEADDDCATESGGWNDYGAGGGGPSEVLAHSRDPLGAGGDKWQRPLVPRVAVHV